MATCASCGGLGRVGPCGITSQVAQAFGISVRSCPLCHGTGQAARTDRRTLPRQRTANRPPDLPGDWIVEIHHSGRILAVMRFLLVHSGSFDAHCEFGGPTGWQATGEWTVSGPDRDFRFTGTQSSPYLLTTGYHWGVTLAELNHNVLHGESISHEWTMWNRTSGLPAESELDSPRTAAELQRA